MINETIGHALTLRHTRHGLVTFRTNDMYLGRCLDLYGEFSVGEQEVFQKLVKPDMLVMDIGANIGIHTMELSRMAKLVISIEPERQIYRMLCANITLNDLGNVLSFNAACGSDKGEIRVPSINFGVDGNFGCLSLGNGSSGDWMPLISVDSLSLGCCGFMKIDVEGMEAEVIRGARKTIDAFRPALYVENDREEKSEELIGLLLEMGYYLCWHFPALFNKENYAGNAEDVFSGIVSLNMICFPSKELYDAYVPQISQTLKINSPKDWWRGLV